MFSICIYQKKKLHILYSLILQSDCNITEINMWFFFLITLWSLVVLQVLIYSVCVRWDSSIHCFSQHMSKTARTGTGQNGKDSETKSKSHRYLRTWAVNLCALPGKAWAGDRIVEGRIQTPTFQYLCIVCVPIPVGVLTTASNTFPRH